MSKTLLDYALSIIKEPIVLGITVLLSLLLAYLVPYLQSLKSALLLQVPLWAAILLGLSVLCLISVPAWIINRDNKLLKNKLDLANQAIQDLNSNSNTDQFLRNERKARIQKWRDDVSSCNGDIQKFHKTPSYFDLQSFLTEEESSLINAANSTRTVVLLKINGKAQAITSDNNKLKYCQDAINRLEKEWNLI